MYIMYFGGEEFVAPYAKCNIYPFYAGVLTLK